MSTSTDCANGIPMPIVTLNRVCTAAGVLLALLLRQPAITTALFALLVPAALFGSRASLVFLVGRKLFVRANATAPTEDRRLMRFNNSLAAIMLGLAQAAFLAHLPLLGWIFACAVALAATVALSGFCVGCFLFFRFKMARYRLFGA
jgi:hypothetical protein